MSALPTLFVSHGAPTFALSPGLAGAQLHHAARQIAKPEAILVVSAHWSTARPMVAITPWPDTVHDFGGFAPQLYGIEYPAPGHPQLAQRAIEVLRLAGWDAAPDMHRGLDHGAWVPLLHMYPDAEVPVFQVSMPHTLTPHQAIAYGKALSALTHEGVLIVGSGSLTHNLMELDHTEAASHSVIDPFVAWVRQALLQGDATQLAQALEVAPLAKRMHPTDEHFLPLLIAFGAAVTPIPCTLLPGGTRHGVLSMESYVFGQLIEQVPLAIAA